jgi:hypothetical protein
MVDRERLPVDRVVLIACGTGALLMTALTMGAADAGGSAGGAAVVAAFVALGLVPYGLTALLSRIRAGRRLVTAATRTLAFAYGAFDCGLRYLALYHPTGSTDAVVVAVLPFWWLPMAVIVAALTAATLWILARRTGRPAFT